MLEQRVFTNRRITCFAAKTQYHRMIYATLQNEIVLKGKLLSSTIDGCCQSVTNFCHGEIIKMCNESRQAIFVNGMHMIKIDGGGVFKPLFDADDHFTGDAIIRR